MKKIKVNGIEVYGIRVSSLYTFIPLYLYFLIPLYLYTSIPLCAQSIQELENKLSSAPAEDKPAILNQLSEAYLKTYPNKSINYAEQALKESRTINDINGTTDALVNLGDGYNATRDHKKAIQHFMEAIKVFDEYNEFSSSAYLWNKIADSYLSAQQYAEALDANKKAMDLYKKAGDKNGMANMQIDIGDIYFKQQKYEISISNYQQALGMYEGLKDAKGQVVTLNRIGTSYSQWGNYEEAYSFLTRALDVAQKNNLTSLANTISQNMDVVKKNLSNRQKSKTEFDVQSQKVQEQQIQAIESEITVLASKNIKSLAEIEQLSEESQLKELKIKTQQEEILRKQMATEAQIRANELLKKEKALAESELHKQRLITGGSIGFATLGVLLTAIIFAAYRSKKKANKLLMQKNEIINNQNEQITKKNILITDSIDYAKNIQDAILPPAYILSKHFRKSFIYYKPKDIVSGDFFWIHEGKDNNSICVAAADCTGHGVPGAFMSLLGFIMMDDIERRNAYAAPADILKEVNTQLMSVLHQNTDNRSGKFGMDIALIKYDKIKKEVKYSGAHNPLVVISSGQVNEIKGDRVAIGTTLDCSFTNHSVQVKEGDMLYLYSDGYQDQIGGEKRKKFLAFQLKELLQQIYTLEPEKQKEYLNKKHLEWRGKVEQIDDILIIGLKV